MRRPYEISIPNVAVDIDITCTGPFGRRPEDRVATRCLPIPKTPANPLKNDKEFPHEFSYLAEPRPEKW